MGCIRRSIPTTEVVSSCWLETVVRDGTGFNKPILSQDYPSWLGIRCCKEALDRVYELAMKDLERTRSNCEQRS